MCRAGAVGMDARRSDLQNSTGRCARLPAVEALRPLEVGAQGPSGSVRGRQKYAYIQHVD